MDQGRAEVRIMTAHAAKGLEAPIVFLVDNGARPFSEQHLPRLLPFDASGKFWPGKGYLWRAAADIANGNSRAAAARIKEAAEEEYRRLLYVGMTRAEDRLIVCGYFGKIQPTAGTWHSLVTAALAGAPAAEAQPDPILAGTRYRYRIVQQPPRPERSDIGTSQLVLPKEAPAWLGQPVPAEAVLPRPLTPSRASASIEGGIEPVALPKSPVLEAGDEPSLAIARGLAVHRLLQMLPGIADGDREAAARRYIARVGSAWSPSESDSALRSVMRVLADATFAPIFSTDSRAEVGVAGTLAIGGVERSISGKIDRLAVTAAEVLIVDYKTNRPGPARLDEVPQAYVTQLALYRALLQPLYPDRTVKAALLFTEAPLLIAVPAAAMDDALVRLTRA